MISKQQRWTWSSWKLENNRAQDRRGRAQAGRWCWFRRMMMNDWSAKPAGDHHHHHHHHRRHHHRHHHHEGSLMVLCRPVRLTAAEAMQAWSAGGRHEH